jgi:hypothetical protein
MPYLRYLCLFAYSGVQYILCLSSCGVPNVVSFSGLSIFDCPFSFLYRLFIQELIFLRHVVFVSRY